MQAHTRNAQLIAEFLEGRPEVERVYYPGLPSHPQHALAQRQMTGFGGMLSFDIKGGAEAAFKFVEGLTLFAFAESLGGVESLIEHPDTMSHASMTPASRAAAGIKAGNLRVSVGIEHPDDLIADMTSAIAGL
jgi:cystathionine beta-lyase/cystathionine gamma-synthase